MTEGDILIFDKWANEMNIRVQAWRRGNGDVRLVIVSEEGNAVLAQATLASYRAEDLQKALKVVEEA